MGAAFEVDMLIILQPLQDKGNSTESKALPIFDLRHFVEVKNYKTPVCISWWDFGGATPILFLQRRRYKSTK